MSDAKNEAGSDAGPFAYQPPPRADGKVALTITYLELTAESWTQRGQAPEIDVTVVRENAPTVPFYRDIYDSVGRPWLWFERRMMSDANLAALMARPDHELHIARHDNELVGYFELCGTEIMFFGLTMPYIGRRIGPWLLDRAIERSLSRGAAKVELNTNTLDHPRALQTYRKAGFRMVRSESRELPDPRVLWPDIYRWPPK